jgi:hypothetical protein
MTSPIGLALTCFAGNRTIYRYLMLAPQTVMRAPLKTSVAENAGQQHTHTASRTSRSRSGQRNSHLCSRTSRQSNASQGLLIRKFKTAHQLSSLAGKLHAMFTELNRANIALLRTFIDRSPGKTMVVA